jgi:hypothetical protein
MGLILGAGLLAIALPFLAIGVRSGLFRPRLLACLRLSADPDPVAGDAQDG